MGGEGEGVRVGGGERGLVVVDSGRPRLERPVKCRVLFLSEPMVGEGGWVGGVDDAEDKGEREK